jgi:hypothetical protein
MVSALFHFLLLLLVLKIEGKQSSRESAQDRVPSYFMFESQENLPDFVQHQLSGSLQSEEYCFPPCASLLLSLYMSKDTFFPRVKHLEITSGH